MRGYWKFYMAVFISSVIWVGSGTEVRAAESSTKAECIATELTESELQAAGLVQGEMSEKGKEDRGEVGIAAASALANGTYYISNLAEGGYLYYSSSLLGMRTTIASGERKIQWVLTLQSNGYYTIRNGLSGCYLDYGNGEPILSYSDSAIAAGRCYWNVVINSNGCRIQSRTSGQYLALKSISSTSAQVYLTSSVNNAAIWRIVNRNSYGTTSSYQYKELTGFSATAPELNMDQTGKITITKSPASGTLWTNSTDFAYIDKAGKTGYYFSLEADGSYKAKLPAYTKVKVVHKVTGLTTYVNIRIKAKASLMGVIPKDSGERYSGISYGKDVLESIERTPINYQYRNNFTTEEMINSLKSSELIVTRSHGTANNITINEISETVIWSSNIPALSDRYTKIVAFVGCETAKTPTSGTKTITEVTHENGVPVVIGFTTKINRSLANDWTSEFIRDCGGGCQVGQAIQYAAEASGIISARVIGDEHYVWK